MIAYPPGLPFLAAFVACLRTGIIACSVYPPDPSSKARGKFPFEQFNNQVADAGAKYALTTRGFNRLMQVAPFTVGQTTKVEWIATDKTEGGREDLTAVPFALAKTDIAFIQYSSGSTGVPKGVMLPHGAMLHNLSSFHAVSF
jgi:acyl-CoA synthetase (AMP-forming)/AMP-acid ligase II